MKSEIPEKVWKRFYLFGFLLLAALLILDKTAYKARLEEEKNLVILDALDGNRILSDELNLLFKRVQDDFNFINDELLILVKLRSSSPRYQSGLDSLIRFLETHQGYFMVRATNAKGDEIFKLIKEDDGKFKQSMDYFNLSDQPFYQELNTVLADNFFFSSMEPLIINGVKVQPMHPTIRISKRITFDNGDTGLLIFNIDGERILELFSPKNQYRRAVEQEKALIDGSGKYVASSPLLDKETYVQKGKSLEDISPNGYSKLKVQKSSQGSIILNNGLLVYSKISLPHTTESWFLVTNVPESIWIKTVYKKRMTWIFWGLLCFFLLMFWYWKHENKRYKDEVLEVLLKERNEFIQNVSHQIKTPLAIMHNSLNNRNPSLEDWNELRKEISHLIKVVEDMLLLALVEANPTIPLEREDILEIVSDSIVMVGPKSKEKNISIRLNVDEKLYNSSQALERPVMGDLLKSALMNLLDNALDFSPKDDVVDVFVTLYGNQLKIQIKDNGPGISEDILPHLFKPFTRSKYPTRKGTGLGLSITRKIIELHKGDIRISEYKNGTTFEVTL